MLAKNNQAENGKECWGSQKVDSEVDILFSLWKTITILEICHTNPITVTEITGNFTFLYFLCSLQNRIIVSPTENKILTTWPWAERGS